MGWDRLALTAVAVGALVRAVWVLWVHPPYEHVYSDMAGYVGRATELAAGAGFDRYDAFYPPGTHLLLAAPLALAGPDETGLRLAACLWWALSAATLVFAWRLSRTLLGPAPAAIGVALLAVWPLHVTYAGYFLSETPSLAFLAASLWAGHRSLRAGTGGAALLALTAGVLGGLALSNRPQFALNLAILGVAMIAAGRPWLSPRRLAPALALTAGAAAVLAVVVAHNSLAAGKLTGPSENGGLTFFLGHCDARTVTAGREGGPIFVFGAPPAIQRGSGLDWTFRDELAWEQSFYYRQGLDCARRNGLGHARILARNVMDMGASTVPWPQVNEPGLREVVQAANVLYTVAIPAVVVLALAAGRRGPALAPGIRLLLWHLAMVVPLAIIIFGDPRFRAPYDLFGLLLAGAVIAAALPASPGRSGSAAVRPDPVLDQPRLREVGPQDPLDVHDIESRER